MARPDPWSGMTVTTGYLAPKVANVQFSPLVDFIDELTTDTVNKIRSIRGKGSSMAIADMFDLQMSMNKLQQASDMTSGVVGAVNAAISTINRNLKG